MRYYIILFVAFFCSRNSTAQLGFFENYWQEKDATFPVYVEKSSDDFFPDVIVNIDPTDTITKISPYIAGYNLNTYFGGRIYDKPGLLEHIRNLDLPFVRYPGGSGSNWYFWGHTKPNKPSDIDTWIEKGEEEWASCKWGKIENSDYLGLDEFYRLTDSLGNEAVNVVNYSYARYGRSENPVAQAAHYAADWVRYDNGRTKFWEIGNEHYGNWEAGYKINTDKNLDGQPETLTGNLYAQHCMVFLDSMRAAAAEIGSEIRIGAVMGFSTNYNTYNEQVFSTLNNNPDFYSLHKYFGNWENVSAEHILNSLDSYDIDRNYIDALNAEYCDPPVPLIQTEWNTRYSGQDQNTSCANGMHIMLGLKKIINAKTGLSCRWNLIWSNSNGNTHGLITSDESNLLIEGIPAYTPRTPYFYLYHFKKILGDASVKNVSSSEDLEVFSSVFSSGESGIVLVNKSSDAIQTAVALDNYTPGTKYYTYLLEPKGDALSKKVLINGVENEVYEAGGPENYENIPANAFEYEQGIKIHLPPWSTCYILTEGAVVSEELLYELSYTIYGRSGDVILPLENTLIEIGGTMVMTDSEGKVMIQKPAGNYTYKLSAKGHESSGKLIDVSQDLSTKDTLDIENFDIGFLIKYSDDNTSVDSATIDFNSQSKNYYKGDTTFFNDIAFGSYPVYFEVEGYSYQKDFRISKDSTIVLFISKPTFELQFKVKEIWSDKNLSASSIEISGQTGTTQLDGTVVFTLVEDTYEYLVSKENYENINASLYLQKDTIVEVILKALYADVKFKLYKEGVPLNKAQIGIGEDSLISNNLGIALFQGLETEKTHSYSVRKENYESLSGEFSLRIDTTIQLEMIELGIKYGELNLSIYPNPVNEYLFIRSDVLIESMSLFTLQGKKVFEQKGTKSKELKISTENINEGIYFLHIRMQKEKEKIKKVIIMKKKP